MDKKYCFKRRKWIPEKIRKRLIEECSQEDMLSLDIVYGKGDTGLYKMRNKAITLRNQIMVDIFGNLEVPFMSVLLTQKCTLRCKYCSDLIPHYTDPIHFSGREVIYWLKKYLSVVDHVHFLLLCGGETLLYPELERILIHCLREKKILKIGIVTNGTIMPSDRLCSLLANKKVRVRISDYKCVKEKREKTIQYLKDHRVIVEDLKGQKWFDVGGFEKRNRSTRQLMRLFHDCSMNRCFEINRNKVIYCARQRGGELGLIPKMPSNDHVSLRTDDRHALRTDLLNMYDKAFLAACDHCDGITRYSAEVVAGEQ